MADSVSALNKIELNSSSEIATYCNELRDLLRRIASQVEVTAAELQGDLYRTPNAEGHTATMDAKAVTVHLTAVKAAVHLAAKQALSTNKSYRKRFMESGVKKNRPPINKDA